MGKISDLVVDRRSPLVFETKKACIKDESMLESKAVIGSDGVGDAAQGRGETPKGKKTKSVRFNEEKLAEIIEFEDDVESKNVRKLYWETVAADRYRFKDRIERLAKILSPVLSSNHRNVVYTRRVMTTTTTVMTTTTSTTTTTLPIFGSLFLVDKKTHV